MEEGIFRKRELKRILITGPESTGKTVLAGTLATHYKADWLPEYARGYVERLDRPYTRRDVEQIAREQVRQYELTEKRETWIFFDTWLVLTKVWLEWMYGRCPEWIEEALHDAQFDLVLLCAPDIPWIPDPVRENGGENRKRLFNLYRDELNKLQMNWEIVTGAGAERLKCALQIINRRF